MEENEMTQTEQTEAACPESTETVQAEEAAPQVQTPVEPEAEPAAPKKTNTLRIGLSAAALVVVLAVLIAAILSGAGKNDDAVPEDIAEAEASQETVAATVPADGNPDDETCKGTYTQDDAAVLAARDTVVARAGDKELTNAQLQVYYWMEVRNFLNNYGAYAAYFGLDVQQPLDTQVCPVAENGETWQQYFLNAAVNSWHHYQAMAAEAEEQNIPVSQEFQEIIDSAISDLESTAAANGFDGALAILTQTLGNTVTVADYESFMQIYYGGYSYYHDRMDLIQPTDEELEAYFDAHADSYSESEVTKETRTVDVRHILITPEGEGEYTEEAWAAALEQAESILAQWQAEEATEESFAALANEHSTDPGSNTNGGLYTDVTPGQMVEAFNDWCFDSERQIGDTGIVQTNYGYHIMFYVGDQLVWKGYAKNDMIGEKGTELIDAATARFPLTVDWSAIVLGDVIIA